jgi:ribosome-associated protein
VPEPRKILLKKSAQGIKFFGGVNTIDSKEIAVVCAKTADNKKAQNIIILDISKLTSITRYFVICTGINERQWILIDYGDVIVHLFDKEMRIYYDLELLWGDAPKVKW